MFSNRKHKRERGQSITEFAIMLPVLLIIVLGTLEVTNLITSYNRLQLVAREGARFGGGGGDNEGILTIVMNANENSLEAEFEDIYIVRPVIGDGDVNEGEDGWVPGTWVEEHIYGDGPETSGLSGADIYNDFDNPGLLAGTELIVVIVNYDADTVLGLPMMSFSGFEGEEEGRVPLRAYGIMPLLADTLTVDGTATCSFFPMAINLGDLDFALDGDMDGIINAPPGTDFEIQAYGSSNYREFDFLVCAPRQGCSDAAHAMNSGCYSMGQSTNPNPENDPSVYLTPPYPHDASNDDDCLGVGEWVFGINADEYAGIQSAFVNHCDVDQGGGNCPEPSSALPMVIYDLVEEHPTDQNNGKCDTDYVYRVCGTAFIQIRGYDKDSSLPTTIRMIWQGWDTPCQP